MRHFGETLCFCEGHVMAWGCCKYDAALPWSTIAVLDGCIQVFLAFLVLLCTFFNFVTSSFIRASGFHIPCSCCSHQQKRPSRNVSENARVSRKRNLISAPIVSEVRLDDIRDYSDEYVREGELKKPTSWSKVYSTPEASDSALEVSAGEGGTVFEVAQSGQLIDNLNDRSQEDVDRDQYANDQELLHALQSERESMAALYSELEEERNSSATAASEALAMISRLQEEKAAIQMESRQFQRMVMEKAMYDQEVIEVLKEILAKREEERIALEEEVRLYRDRLDGLLMEVKDFVQGDDLPMLSLEGTALEDKLASPKFDRAEMLLAERHSPVRLAKDEETEFLDRLNKTKSQLLTALLQEGIPEPASALVESLSFANEIHEAMAKIPARAESLPTLDNEVGGPKLVSSGLGSVKTGHEIGLPILPPEDFKKESVKLDDGEAAEKPVFASRDLGLPTPAIAEEQIESKPLMEDNAQVVDEVVSADLETDVPAPPVVAVKVENKKLKDDGKNPAAKPKFNSLLSLKRRWSARGSQEISAGTLAKAKEDRRTDVRSLSVLEYVRNLEEQLQQQAGKPPTQLTKASVRAREQGDRFETPMQDHDGNESISKTSGSSGRLDREDIVQRRLFADGDSHDKGEFYMNDASEDEGDDKIYAQQHSFSHAESDGKVSNDDGEFYAVNAGKSEENGYGEALFVHDVYEVQNHPNAAQSKFGIRVTGSTMSSLEMLQSPVTSDCLGKRDNLNDVEEEHSRSMSSEQEPGQFLSNATAFPQEDEDSFLETQWKSIQSTQYKDLCISTSSFKKDNSRSLVEEEVEQLTYRLKALEADRYLMRQTIESLRRENGEMKLIQEIAQQLRELRSMEQNEIKLLDVSPDTFQFQVGVTQACPSTTKKRRFNNTPGGSSCRPSTPGSGRPCASSRLLLKG